MYRKAFYVFVSIVVIAIITVLVIIPTPSLSSAPVPVTDSVVTPQDRLWGDFWEFEGERGQLLNMVKLSPVHRPCGMYVMYEKYMLLRTRYTSQKGFTDFSFGEKLERSLKEIRTSLVTFTYDDVLRAGGQIDCKSDNRRIIELVARVMDEDRLYYQLDLIRNPVLVALRERREEIAARQRHDPNNPVLVTEAQRLREEAHAWDTK